MLMETLLAGLGVKVVERLLTGDAALYGNVLRACTAHSLVLVEGSLQIWTLVLEPRLSSFPQY